MARIATAIWASLKIAFAAAAPARAGCCNRWRPSRTKAPRASASADRGHRHPPETERPVHEWDLARLEESGGLKNNYLKVEQYMETDVFTVHADESVDLVANMMEWEHIRYVPVEDLEHHLVGLVSQRGLLRLMASGALGGNSASVAVADVMRPVARLITVSPETTTVEAIRLMREKRIGCLPVVHDNRPIGVATERDFMDIAS